MTQVWVIHGGDTFDTYEDYLESLKNISVSLDDLRRQGWKSHLPEALGPSFDVVAPRMPNSFNAKYAEWSLWFTKYIPFMQPPVILIGHSLGGIFVTKYLAEHTLGVTIQSTHLVAAPFASNEAYSLADFTLPASLDTFASQSQRITLYYSQDDPVVPFHDLAHYQTALPKAKVRIFADRQHFNQAEFPEIVEDIKSSWTP